MLSLLLTSRQIRDEVLFTVRHLLRLRHETRLFVEAQRSYRGWKAAVVQDSNDAPTDFVIPAVGLTPRELFSKTKRPYFHWPANMSAWRQNLLLQAFDSLTFSVSWVHYFMVQVTITVPDSGQQSVDVRLLPHPQWREGFTTYPNEYVELKGKNDTAIAKLQAGIERRVRAGPRIDRELIKDVVGILSNVGWHFYSQEKDTLDSHDLDGTFKTMWHISVPSTASWEEKLSREAEKDVVRKLGHELNYSCCSM